MVHTIAVGNSIVTLTLFVQAQNRSYFLIIFGAFDYYQRLFAVKKII